MNKVLNEKSQDVLKNNSIKENKDKSKRVKIIVDKYSEFDWDWIFDREWLRTKK